MNLKETLAQAEIRVDIILRGLASSLSWLADQWYSLPATVAILIFIGWLIWG